MRGCDRLSCWFGLSHASWLTLPRVFMEAMPDEWQGKMAELLWQITDEFPDAPVPPTLVQAVGERGRFAKFPEWILNYRRPDRDKIEASRRKSDSELTETSNPRESGDNLAEREVQQGDPQK